MQSLRQWVWRTGAALTSTLAITSTAVFGGAAPAQAAGTVPAYDHIFTIIMENYSYSQIIGDPTDAPYIHSLATTYGLGSNSFAAGHPSLPNYLELTGGSNNGITTDCSPSTNCEVNAPNVATDRVEPSGRTWKAYMESMPSNCFLSNSGEYAVRHNPFVYYRDIQTNPTECNKDVPYTQLPTDLASTETTPNYAWITPNLIDDMHDGTIAQGDAWLSQNVPTILNSPAFTTQNSALQIIWDEDNGSENDQIPDIVITSGMVNGTANKPYNSFQQYNHFSNLKTIESAWGLPPLTPNDGGSSPEGDLFDSAPTTYPSAPQTVTATAGKHGTATISWQPPTNDGGCAVSSYAIAASPLNVGTTTVSASTTSATVSGLAKGVTYTFTVAANNCNGSSPQSAASNQITAS
jgi:phosphatidylinositol-3-phosphatase